MGRTACTEPQFCTRVTFTLFILRKWELDKLYSEVGNRRSCGRKRLQDCQDDLQLHILFSLAVPGVLGAISGSS